MDQGSDDGILGVFYFHCELVNVICRTYFCSAWL